MDLTCEDWATVLYQVFHKVVFNRVPREYPSPRTEKVEPIITGLALHVSGLVERKRKPPIR